MRQGTCRVMGAALLLGAAGLWACGETTKPPPRVASVVVTSPIGPRLAVGRTVQLAAVAKDGGGNVLIGRVIQWSSSAPGVAAVSGSGLVTGVAEGSATITAVAEEVQGSSTHQVLAADLVGARTLLTDPFAVALVGGLSSAVKAQVQGAVTQCGTGLEAGNFDTMEAALTAVRAGITGASDPTDKALGATFALFVDQAYRLLRL